MNVYYCKRGTTHTRRSKYTICLKKGFSLFSKKKRTERLCKKGLVESCFIQFFFCVHPKSFLLCLFLLTGFFLSPTKMMKNATKKKQRAPLSKRLRPLPSRRSGFSEKEYKRRVLLLLLSSSSGGGGTFSRENYYFVIKKGANVSP